MNGFSINILIPCETSSPRAAWTPHDAKFMKTETGVGVFSVALMLVFGLAIVLTGCSHTHVSDGSGTGSPDGKFHLSVGCDGANGRAYTDKTRKKVRIGIRSGDEQASMILFEHTYTVTGSDITWETHWSSDDTVSVELYDWGDGVANYNNMLHLAASNHIALFVFTLDRTTGKFAQRR